MKYRFLKLIAIMFLTNFVRCTIWVVSSVLIRRFLCTKIFVSVSADSEDLHDVLDYLGEKQGKCYDIGGALRLSEDRLAKIRSECPSNNNTEALRMIIDDWLRKKYTTKRHGLPTWKALVKAVKSPFGGDDPELAERIAKHHPPQPSEGILICMCTVKPLN